MRVLIVIPHLRPGGAERQAFETARELQHLGVHVDVCGLSGPRLFARDRRQLSTEYPTVNSFILAKKWNRLLGGFLDLLSALRGLFRRRLFRISQSNGHRAKNSALSGPPRFLMWLMAKLFGENSHDPFSHTTLVELFRQRPRLVWESWLLTKRLYTDSPDLVLSFLAGPNLSATIAGQIVGIPVVVSERNDVALRSGPSCGDSFAQKMYSSASLVTANTEVASRDLAGVFGDSEVRWFPNQSSYREVLSGGSRSGARHVVVMARLVPQKNTAAVIESLAQGYLLAEGTELSVFGSGRELGRLRRLARRLGVDSRVHFFGYRPLSEIRGLIDGVGCAVVNSAFEGSSNSLHEAVRMGLVPVVASTVREVGDIVSPELAERIVTDGSAGSIAEVVGRLYRSEEFYAETWGLVQRDFGAYWVRASRVREEFFRDLLGEYSTL